MTTDSVMSISAVIAEITGARPAGYKDPAGDDQQQTLGVGGG
jgi:hypothetical protein